jgi:hypothetical protein
MQDQQGEPHEDPRDQQDQQGEQQEQQGEQQDQQGEQQEDSDCCALFKVFIIMMYIIWIRPLIIYVLYLGADSNIFAVAICGNFIFVIISIIVISLYENCMKLCAKCHCCKRVVYKMIFICANVEN